MESDLSLLSVEELKALFMQESLKFTEQLKKGDSFAELRIIRIKLKDIALEMKQRRKASPEGNSN
jgi:hypothetical protein